MTASPTPADDLLTVDELAAATGLTVRTTRYYASLGLLPPPVRRGRLAYYGPAHRARLELVTAMQEHGYTLTAIERHLATISQEATAEEVALQGSLLLAWTPTQVEEVDRGELARRAGRDLSEEDLAWLEGCAAISPVGDGRYRVVPFLDLALELRATGFPVETLAASNAAVRRHMDALVEELHELMTADVLAQLGSAEAQDTRRLEHTLGLVRRLSQEAVGLGYQRAQRNLLRKQREASRERAIARQLLRD